MTPRGSASAKKSETASDQLQHSVEELSQNVRALTDVMEHVREELSWLARNGLPHQPLSLRMSTGDPSDVTPTDSTAESTCETDESPVTSKVLEQACDWLAENFASLLEEQLSMIVESQDGLKKQILQSIAGEVPGKSRRPKEKQLVASHDSIPAPLENSGVDSITPATVAATPDHSQPTMKHWELGDAVEFTLDGREMWGEVVALDAATNTATVLLIPAEEEVTVPQNLLQPEYASERDGQKLSPLSPENRKTRPTVPENPSSGRLF